MDLQTIARLANLPVRKIRYVLDHRLLPGTRARIQHNVVGRARTLTDFEGFSVACAAILLESGLKKVAVVNLMDGLAEPILLEARKTTKNARRDEKTSPLLMAFKPGINPVRVMLGDGVNLRFTYGDQDTGWLQLGTHAPLADKYEPRIVISVDLASLRDVFRHLS